MVGGDWGPSVNCPVSQIIRYGYLVYGTVERWKLRVYPGSLSIYNTHGNVQWSDCIVCLHELNV